MSIESTNTTNGLGAARFDLTGGTAGRVLRPASSGSGFAEILKDSIREVKELQNQADIALRELTQGRTTNVAEVLHRLEKADVAFRTLLGVRNELIAAYDEIRGLRV